MASRWMRPVAVFGAVLMLILPVSVRADEAAQRLAATLQLDEVITVLRDEGIAHGRELDQDMLGGTGGDYWRRQVERIHDRDRMRAAMVRAFRDGMSEAEIAGSIAFFDTDTGQTILALETSARRAIADPQVEAIARASYDELRGSDDPHFAAVARFVEVNDLLERNVAGVMSATYRFYRGMADGGALDLDEGSILADVWSGEAETRADTESWLYGFLLMAYRPLDADAMAAYNAFSETPAGRALNAALFDGFDALYGDISYGLGRAVAQAMSGSEL